MEVIIVKKTSKTHIEMVHVPKFIANTNFPLGFTSEQLVEVSTLVLRCVVPQVSHQ